VRLRDVRSADGKMTLMNYLVDMVSRSDQHVVDLPKDFAELKKIRMVSIRDLVAQAGLLKKTLVKLAGYRYKPLPSSLAKPPFEGRFKEFLDSARDQLEKLSARLSETKEAWTATAGYFVEDLEEYESVWDSVSTPVTALQPTGEGEEGSKGKQPEALFAGLDLFMSYVDEAARQNKKTRDDEARKVKRAKEAEEKAKRDREKKEKVGQAADGAGEPVSEAPKRRLRRPSGDAKPMSFSDVVMQAAMAARGMSKLGLDFDEELHRKREPKIKGKGMACAGCGKLTGCECKF